VAFSKYLGIIKITLSRANWLKRYSALKINFSLAFNKHEQQQKTHIYVYNRIV